MTLPKTRGKSRRAGLLVLATALAILTLAQLSPGTGGTPEAPYQAEIDAVQRKTGGNPPSAESLTDTAILRQKGGDATTARQLYRKALEINPSYEPAIYGMETTGGRDRSPDN